MKYFRIATCALVLSMCGVALASPNAVDKFLQKLDVLTEVLALIHNNYVDSVDPKTLIYAAAKGAVSALDEHSEFYTPEEYRELVAATQGEYAGVGVEVAWEAALPEIVSVFEGSPAERAGIRPGDTILKVDEVPAGQFSLESLLEKLRGPVGTSVRLLVQRFDRKGDWSYTLRRNWIRVRAIQSEFMSPRILYVHIDSFSRRVSQDVERLLRTYQDRYGLILDLRDNPGGLFDEAVAIADLFLKDGLIVAAVGRSGDLLESHEAKPRTTDPAGVVAVLVNEGSASAAEIVAAALQDRGRARIFGERTFGKGSVQTILELGDGSGLKVTVARYVTASGKTIEGKGVMPDVVSGKADPVFQATAWIQSQVYRQQ